MKDLLGEMFDTHHLWVKGKKEGSLNRRINRMLLLIPQHISTWEQLSAQSRMTA